MAYQKFIPKNRILSDCPGDSGDNGDKIAKSVGSVATVAAVTAPHTFKPRIWSHPEIMALPIMPCTTCIKFKWGRRPSCGKYQALADPKKGCRCVHYEGRA